MVLDNEFMDMEEHAAMLQNKAIIQNNVVSKRKEQLKHWEDSEMNKLCPKRQSFHQSKVKFQDRDIFLSACQSGDEEEVEVLLQKGSNINFSSIDGVTALHQAVIDGNFDIVRFLVEHGADINAQDNEGWTPLHAAVCCGNLSITKYLYEHGADLSCVNSDKELSVDLAENDEIRAYLEHEMHNAGLDEQKAREKEFNLMLEDCGRWIQSGKYVDKPHPRTGATSLHVAASKGYNKLIGMLIRAGASIHAQDFEGWTPLHAAAHWGERDACRILMENGGSLDALTHTGHNVLAVADKSIEEFLYCLKEKFNELRSTALQHQQQSNGVLQDASNLAKDTEEGISNGTERVGTPSGLHGADKLQSAAIRRISSGDKLATKRKDVVSDENVVANAVKRLSPPVPAERHSLMRREDMMNGRTVNIEIGDPMEVKKMEDGNLAEEDLMDEEEVEDESEWTEVTATPSSSHHTNSAVNNIKKSTSADQISAQKDFLSSNNHKENVTTSPSKVPLLEQQSGIALQTTPENVDSLSAETASSSSNRRKDEKSTATSHGSSLKEESTTSSSSTRESSHSGSPSSYSSDRSNTGSGVSSIQTSSRSMTPKECSSSLYSSDQSVQFTVTQPVDDSQHSTTPSSITSSTTTNNKSKSHSSTNHKSAVLRAAEETVKRLRKQLPQVQTGVERAKSQSVDYGKPSPPLDPPLKSPPASAPLVQSARQFWNSIGNNVQTTAGQQNHPLGSTQLHQQQFSRSRQRFAVNSNSLEFDSPFAIVAGEQKKPDKTFKRGDSLRTGMDSSSAKSSFASQSSQRRQQQKFAHPIERAIGSNKLTVKPAEFLFGAAPVITAPLATITSASNTPSDSQSCSSSLNQSPSPSPIVNSPFITIRKQSWQQATPPTQPTSQNESESERKAKSKLKRSTRRSTQGVTLEQLGEATSRLHAQHNNHIRGEFKTSTGDRIQQANAKYNLMMEQQKIPRDPPHHQLQPPGSPGCSSASSSSAYITASNSRHNANAAQLPKEEDPALPVVNFSSTALLIDELNKYKQLYEKERDECDRLRLQIQELSADARTKASNVLRGVGWRPGSTLIQRTELPSGLTYSTVTRDVSRNVADDKNTNGLNLDDRQTFEKRIEELERELENMRELRMKNNELKSENESLVRILARNSRNNYLTSEQRKLPQNTVAEIRK